MLKSSPASSPSGQDHFFLTNAINWEPASTKKISIKIKGIKNIRQIINIYFNLKARPWQIGAVIDIIKYKRDICAIANTNADKSFVYQSILIVTSRFVLVILPTIALMEDQVCIAPKILYYYY